MSFIYPHSKNIPNIISIIINSSFFLSSCASIVPSYILLYILADKLGHSAIEVDETIKKSLKFGIVEEDNLEKQGGNLTKLFNHLKERR